MKVENKEVSNRLNDLLEKMYDSEKGFEKAAEHVDHSALKAYFNKKSIQRREFGHELKSQIKNLGQNPDKGVSIKGNMHHAWMDIKAIFSSDNDESMLEEAIRGEKATLNDYEEVLNDTHLPINTRNILLNQKGQIENGLSTIKQLEDLA